MDKDKANYLIITTAVNETERQYHCIFSEYLQFNDFNVKTLKRESEDEVKTSIKTNNKNIIIVSDMYIKNNTSKKYSSNDKIKKIPWLKKMNFNYVFLDESHKGGTTEKANDMMNYYGEYSTHVYITATYLKPAYHHNIPKTNWILWDLEDATSGKTIHNENSQNRLIEKYGEEFKSLFNIFSLENIRQEYSKYTELWVLTHELKPDIIDKIINKQKQ